jgi:hypothetical protein
MGRLSPCLLLAAGTWAAGLFGAQAATWYLQNKATGDWNTLANWNSSPFGGGTNPTSISSSDNFDLNGFGVDTPKLTSGTTTFGGNELIFHGGSAGAVSTKTISPATIAIPKLVSDGGTILCAISGAVIGINITTLTNNANTTFNGNGKGLGLNLTIGTLSGPGGICAQGTGSGSAGGVVDLNVASATAFTGTLHICDGCQFTFENAMTSGGALEVEGTSAGTAVTLNYTVTFNGLTINGTTYSTGTYSSSALGFTGSGSVVVQPAAVATYTVTQLYGVNFSGGESSNRNYPTKAYYWNYYNGKSLNLIRVPFSWEGVQPTLGGPLNTTALASLDKAVSLAAADGMQAILDMHNYDRYTTSTGTYVIGTGTVTYADYQQVWQLLAAHFAGETGIYAYEIMSEPHDDNGTWVTTTAQDGVDGVRQGDTTHFIIVDSDSYAGGQAWMANNQNLNVTDPVNRIIYSAHTYWDSNDSGAYNGSYDSNNDYPNVGVDRVASFIYWLNLKGAQGFVGEFGVPNNVSNPDYRWNVVLSNFLQDLNTNGVSGTLWGTYNLKPTYLTRPNTDNGSECFDAPAMAVLQLFGSTPGITSGTPPAGASGSAYSFAFQASNYPYATFTLASGTLPPGLTLSPAGVLSGTPTQSGSYTFTIAAGNGVVTLASQSVTLNITAPAGPAETPTMPRWALGILALLLSAFAARLLPGDKTDIRI